MKKLFIMLVAAFSFVACTNTETKVAEKESDKPEDAQDAGRLFIRASLDGDYNKALSYMVKDSMNIMILKKWKNDNYDKLSNEDKINYKNANILPIKIENINDSLVSYAYSNTFKKNDTTVLFIVREKDAWKIDMKRIRAYY